MKILLSILLLFSFAAKAQDTTKYMPMSAKGYKFNGGTFKNIWIGQDTTNYKTGIVRIGFRFFVGNGVYWKEIAGGSSAPSGLTGAVVTQIDSTRFNVSPGSYYIQGSLYANGDTTFNLAQPGDTSRIDVIGLDTLGQVFTITGVESENPYPSSIDPLSQIYLSFVWVDTDTVYFAPTPVNYWSALGNDIIPNNPGKVQFKNGLYVDQITANDSRLFTDKQLILQSNRPTGSKIFAGISGGNVALNTTELQLSLGDNSTTGTAKTALSLTGGSLHASGTEEMNMISITPSIVQSGSYSGSVRGIYYNPTVTSNVGSHYAFESTAGRIKFGGTPSVNDTTSKPVVMDGSGNLSRLNYWPTGSGGGGGVDSSAYWTASVLSDSTGFILCDRRGRCDTIISTERAASIDSILLSNGSGSNIDTVKARKNGTFIPQFTFNAHVDATANNKFSRVYSGVIRATTTGASQPITWAFLDSTTGHQFFGFDSVNGSGNAIRVYYPKVKNVSGFVVTPDETLAQMGVIVGSSVGDSVANIYGYLTTQNTGSLTGNGTTWSNSGLSYTGLTYTSSTGRTVFTPTTSAGTIYTSSPELEGMIIQSIGDSMRYIQRVYSALGGQTVGFRMLDSIGRVDTGALTSGHKLAIIVPRTKTVGIPAQTSNSNGFPNDIYVSTANYWILAQMDVYMIASATSSTTATIEWQTADVPTNIYATNYRITRAPLSSPNTETTLFNGWGFSCLDSGLTANTWYIYRMYATISGTERLITNEKIKTN